MAIRNSSYDDLVSNFRGSNVVISGHTGFKGSWLSFILNLLGANVYGASNSRPDDPRHTYHRLQIQNFIRNENHEDVDVTKKSYGELLRGLQPDFIFHLAAQSLVSISYENPATTFETNTLGILNLLEYLREENKLTTSVIVTSDKCYKNNNLGIPFVETDELGGVDPYSASKAAAEILFGSYLNSFPKLSQYHGTASSRAGNVFGGGDYSPNRLVPDLITGLLENKQVRIRMPNATRPWTYVIDVLVGYLTLATKLKDKPNLFSESWNFASAGSITVNQISLILKEHLGYGDFIIDNSSSIGYEAQLLGINASKANRLLEWNTKISTEVALRETLDWYRTSMNGNNVISYTEAYISKFLKL